MVVIRELEAAESDDLVQIENHEDREQEIDAEKESVIEVFNNDQLILGFSPCNHFSFYVNLAVTNGYFHPGEEVKVFLDAATITSITSLPLVLFCKGLFFMGAFHPLRIKDIQEQEINAEEKVIEVSINNHQLILKAVPCAHFSFYVNLPISHEYLRPGEEVKVFLDAATITSITSLPLLLLCEGLFLTGASHPLRIKNNQEQEINAEEKAIEVSIIGQVYLGGSRHIHFNFNTHLPSTHGYLRQWGELKCNDDLFFEAGSDLYLPITLYFDGVLFPGATMPMMVGSNKKDVIAMIEFTLTKAIPRNIVGLSRVFYDADSGLDIAKIGTTALIQEYRRLEDGSFIVIFLGLQRMMLWRYGEADNEYFDGLTFGDIEILEEEMIGRSPEDICKRMTPNCKEKRGLKSVSKFSKAFLPAFVYNMFDPYVLAQRAAGLWEARIGSPSMSPLLDSPVALSLSIAKRMPVSTRTLQELLEINNISYRLQREIQLLQTLDTFLCRFCKSVIATLGDILVMSTEGPMDAYVCLSCGVNQIITFYGVDTLIYAAHVGDQIEWFPGYLSRRALCNSCLNMVGWIFEAKCEDLKPRKFCGIRCNAICGPEPD